ncbi:DUF4382 domain-containing protein [Negadavirga shengliensis]|uniref:DUF4382 domain-containing protein n=1 Tax=Negadavirga shengliensis TaxID=1389218 RepID=A0ABV9SVN2_9BACT
MKLMNFNLWMSGLLSLLFLVSCNDQEGIMEGHARLNVSLIDAPADYDEVWVEVLAVEVRPGKGNDANETAWISINNEADEKRIDLLTLTGGNAVYLGSTEVPAGKISQIRLILGDDNYIMQDGNRIDLKTPSAQQSGLKLQLNKELMAGIQYDLVIDFDAAKSIVKAGNSGQYILKPVLRVVAEESATIKGTVLPLEAEPVIYGIKGVDTLATFTDDNGDFVLRGLEAGEYRIEIHPKAPYLGDTLLNVPAVRGEITVLDPVELEMETTEEEVE